MYTNIYVPTNIYTYQIQLKWVHFPPDNAFFCRILKYTDLLCILLYIDTGVYAVRICIYIIYI